MSLQRYRYPSSVQIALALETVEIGGAALPFRVAPKKTGPEAARRETAARKASCQVYAKPIAS